jgi:hypothetical protein
MFSFFKKKQKCAFKFRDSGDIACFTCDHVLSNQRPILFVSHDDDEDGTWQFLCGTEAHTGSNAKIVSLKQITELDPTVNELFEMPPGVGAGRENTASNWKLFKLV